jgi:hypothetical protein
VLRGIDGKVKNMERFLEGGGREHPKHLGFLFTINTKNKVNGVAK